MPLRHEPAGELVEKEGIAPCSLVYGSEGLLGEEDFKALAEELTDLIGSKPDQRDPVAVPDDGSEGVRNRGIEIGLRLAVGGEHKQRDVVELAGDERQLGLTRLNGHPEYGAMPQKGCPDDEWYEGAATS